MSNEERPEMTEEITEVKEEVTENKTETAEVKAEAPKKSFMEQALADMVEIREGKKLTCTVIDVKDDGLVVDCGQKKDGFIAVEDLGSEKALADFKEGDEFKAVMIKSQSRDFLSLSKKLFDEEQTAKLAKEEAKKIIAEGEFEVTDRRAHV